MWRTVAALPTTLRAARLPTAWSTVAWGVTMRAHALRHRTRCSQRPSCVGVVAKDKASVRLDKGTAAGNKGNNVDVCSGAGVNLAGCTVADSSWGSGLWVPGEGTCVEAEQTKCLENCELDVPRETRLLLRSMGASSVRTMVSAAMMLKLQCMAPV